MGWLRIGTATYEQKLVLSPNSENDNTRELLGGAHVQTSAAERFQVHQHYYSQSHLG